jgi:hypothetical protein
VSSSASRRERRAERKSVRQMFDEMPALVRGAVNRIAAEYGLDAFASFQSMANILSKILPGNLCVGCAKIIDGSPPGVYAVTQPTIGVIGSMCAGCIERFRTDDKFATKVDHEGFRACYGAGPDDVAGTVQ